MTCPDCHSPRVELIDSIQPDLARYDKYSCLNCGAFFCPQSRRKLTTPNVWEDY